MINKVCRACRTEKPIDDYPYFSTTEAGRKNTCKDCTKKLSEVRKKLKTENPTPPPGICPICELHTDNWILDHCHFSNNFRGYICNSCNLALGRFNDDPMILLNAINYLNSKTSE